MEPITTIVVIAAIWKLVEAAGNTIFEDVISETSEPLREKFSGWVLTKTGITEKERFEVFRDAYFNAETKLIRKHSLGVAYGALRSLPRIIEKNDREMILEMLGNNNSVKQNQTRDMLHSEQLKDFMRILREELWHTKLYRPLIEFYNMEDARRIRNDILQIMCRMANTIDSDLNAIRIKVIETPPDFELERVRYLKQIEANLEEHKFSGFPVLRQEKTPILLNKIYVDLDLHYKGGGDSYMEELESLLRDSSE